MVTYDTVLDTIPATVISTGRSFRMDCCHFVGKHLIRGAQISILFALQLDFNCVFYLSFLQKANNNRNNTKTPDQNVRYPQDQK